MQTIVTLTLVAVLLLASATGAVAQTDAPVTPQQLIEAVDAMSPDQARDITARLIRKMQADRKATSYAPRMGASLAVGLASTFDEVSLPPHEWSGGTPDLEDVSAAELTALWRCRSDRFHWGLRLASFASEDSDMTDAGYTRGRLDAYELTLATQVQIVRAKRWLLWIEIAGGRGSAYLETLDTPTEAASTVREFDGDYWLGDARAGVAWRCSPLCSFYLSGGYRLAEDVDLEEGGSETDATVDPSGPIGMVGFALGF